MRSEAALQLSSIIKKKGCSAVGRVGGSSHYKFVVMNRAKRCEFHKLACVGGREGRGCARRRFGCCHFGQEPFCAQI